MMSIKQLLIMVMLIISFFGISASAATSGVDSQNESAYDSDAFVSQWDTRNVSVGSSASNQIRLPLEPSGTYNFVVDWGDGSTDNITTYNQAEVTHTYSAEGIYTLVITGTIRGWRFNDRGDKLKIVEISQWGNLSLGNSGAYFMGAESLVPTATDAPDLSGTTNLSYTFYGSRKLEALGSMDTWNVSSDTDMSHMFADATSFNQDISTWDVSSVTDMSQMFYYALSFNQPLNP